MAKYDVRRFANPEVLRTIRPDNLIQLLMPFAAYLLKRGVSLPVARLRAANDEVGAEENDAFDYDALAGVLLNPDDDLEDDLVNALYLISECSTDTAASKLLGLASVESTQLLSPADIATQVYLKNPDLLERVHSEQFVGARKSFRYFLSRERSLERLRPSSTTIREIEADLAAWFESKKKGNQVRLVVFPKDTETWFLVRHGEGFKRESAQRSGKSTSIFYRPERYDVAVYTRSTGEFRINAEERERGVYRRVFGRRLFGSDEFFPEEALKYTLEPLKQGPSSIAWSDVPGIDEVVLEEVRYDIGGAHHESKTHSAADLFAALSGRPLLSAPIGSARFKIRFSESNKPRAVIITPPRNAKFTRDSDGRTVAEWLSKRGFDLSRRTIDSD